MRLEALARHLDVSIEGLKDAETTEPYFGSGLMVTVGDKEYYVLTDEEADSAARAYIEESVWAFNRTFLASHMRKRLGDCAEDVIDGLQPEKRCEAANEPLRKLIDDFDYFVEDAITSDGRGHFISPYDGAEHKEGSFFIYRMN